MFDGYMQSTTVGQIETAILFTASLIQYKASECNLKLGQTI